MDKEEIVLKFAEDSTYYDIHGPNSKYEVVSYTKGDTHTTLNLTNGKTIEIPNEAVFDIEEV